MFSKCILIKPSFFEPYDEKNNEKMIFPKNDPTKMMIATIKENLFQRSFRMKNDKQQQDVKS